MRAGLFWVLPVCLALGIAGCATEAPPPPPPAAEAPAWPPPPAPPVTRSAVGAWSFGAGGACTATVAGSVASLELAVDSDTVLLAARLPNEPPSPRGGAVTMAYSGAAGAWSVGGTRRPRQPLVIRAAMNEEQASRILFLLDGGTLRFSEPAGRVSILRIPHAGAQGRAWFECVRQKLAL